MKFATWNVRGGRDAVWAHLRYLAVDIALVQEANPPEALSHAFAPREFEQRLDGAALHIIAFSDELSIIPEPPLARGTVLPAIIGKLGGLRVLNAHAIRDKGQRESHDYQGLRRCVDGIEEYVRATDAPILIGGDFNASVHFSYDTKQCRAEFSRLAALGLTDLACNTGCSIGPSGCHEIHSPTRSYRGGDYRIDYLLVNNRAQAMFERSSVDMTSGALSDHRPVLVNTAG